MHHLFQTKKLLRDLHQSDFHSSAARGWGDEWSDTVPGICVHPSPALPGEWDILHAFSQTSSSLVSPGWCLVSQMKGKSLWSPRNERTVVFLSSLGQQQDDSSGCPCLGCCPKCVGWEGVLPTFSWTLCKEENTAFMPMGEKTRGQNNKLFHNTNPNIHVQFQNTHACHAKLLKGVWLLWDSKHTCSLRQSRWSRLETNDP